MRVISCRKAKGVRLSHRQKLIQEVVQNSGPGIFRLLVKLTFREDVAEDLLQELFIKVLDGGQWNNVRNHHAYLRQTAMNMAFDWRRRQRRSPQIQSLSDEMDSRSQSPLQKLVDVECFDSVLNAIEDLPPKSRGTIVMRFFEEMEYEEIAEQLGKTPHQVRSLCSKGLSRLRESLGQRISETTKETKR